MFYAFTVEALTRWMKSRSESGNPYKLTPFVRSLMKCHNLAICLVSLIMGSGMVIYLYNEGRFNSWQNMSCVNTSNSGLYGLWNMIYLVTKIWEWLDTYFLILQGKEVINLHYFHHMTTFTMAALVHNMPVGGFCFVNCFVHTVMYAYYGNSKTFRWCKRFITKGQLIQFCLVLSVNTFGFMSQPDTCFDLKAVIWEWWYCQFVVVVYFVLFCKFYYDNYIVATAQSVVLVTGEEGKVVHDKDN